MDQTPNNATHLTDRLRAGDRQALGELFHCYRERLRRMVELRMDPRLRARLDASDVLQEAYLELAGDLEAYRAEPKLQPLLGMRLHVGRRLTTLHGQGPAGESAPLTPPPFQPVPKEKKAGGSPGSSGHSKMNPLAEE